MGRKGAYNLLTKCVLFVRSVALRKTEQKLRMHVPKTRNFELPQLPAADPEIRQHLYKHFLIFYLRLLDDVILRSFCSSRFFQCIVLLQGNKGKTNIFTLKWVKLIPCDKTDETVQCEHRETRILICNEYA